MRALLIDTLILAAFVAGVLAFFGFLPILAALAVYGGVVAAITLRRARKGTQR